MKVSIGVSNRHIHLTAEDLLTLCGKTIMEQTKPLRQLGQFASQIQLTIKTQKGEINKIRVLGPTREYTQVEISKTDAYKLGITPPVRESGDLTQAAIVTIIGPVGKLTKACAIIASRHIHIDPETRKELNLEEVDKVSILVTGEKGGVLDNVSIRESDTSYFEMHIDTDDANAHLINCNDNGYIRIEK